MKTPMDYLTPEVGKTNNTQLLTLTQGLKFNFKHGFLKMIESNQFKKAAHEDPMMHLRRFFRLCDTIKQPQVNKEYIRLAAFPFSLIGKA